MEKQEKAIDDVISRNKLPLFNSPKKVVKSNVNGMIAELKNDCHLFSQLYIASQRREGDLDNFFCHENRAFPPAITNNGKMRQGAKSDLFLSLEKVSPAVHLGPQVETKVFDEAAVAHLLPGHSARNFYEYCQNISIPYFEGQLRDTSRVDIVWDTYYPDSLKSATRQERGPDRAITFYLQRRYYGTGNVSCGMMKTRWSCSDSYRMCWWIV